jgi:hypothetical protein
MALAHEIPAHVRVQIHLVAEEGALTALLRVPLEAMRDVEIATRGPGYLELEGIAGQLEDAARLWLAQDLRVYADSRALPAPELLAARVALPTDTAFAGFETARRAIRLARLPLGTDLYWQQAMLEVEFRYPLVSARAGLEIEPTFARLGLRTVTQVRFLAADGTSQSFAFVGNPGRVKLMPGWFFVFGNFLGEGFRHVLGGSDHLLFLLVLVLPVRRLRPLVVIVSAFTLAHSLTLSAAIFDVVPRGAWFPPLVEVLIAGSIVFMALENLLAPALARRWIVAYGFGLVHGFGFSFALRDTLQFAGEHASASLIGFNLGIELGQLLILAVSVPLLSLLLARIPARPAVILASAFVAHTGWHWLLERWEVLSAYSLSAPAWDLGLAVMTLRWLLLCLVAGWIAWLVHRGFARWSRWLEPGDRQRAR